jgi:hypothetical protein
MRLEITDVRTLTDAEPNVRELEFRNKPVTVGSGSDSLLQLPDVEIAAHHANLLPMGEYWVYEPTTRDSETKINGQLVTGKTDLRDGDVIDVRFFSIRVTFDSEIQLDQPDPAQVGDLAKIRQYPLPPRSVTRKPDSNVTLAPARQKLLTDVVLRLRDVHDLATLLEGVAEFLVRELSGRVTWIGIRRSAADAPEFIEYRNEQGVVVGEPPNLETYVYRCLNRQQFITVPRTGHEDTQSVLAVPVLGTRAAVGLIYVDTRKHTRVFDEGDLDFVTLLSRLLAPLVERFLQTGALLPAVGRASPGGLAAAVAPAVRDSFPQWPQLSIAAFARHGQEPGGDFHDVMKLPNGLTALLLVHVDGDAARVAGALAQLRGAFRVAGLHADPPHVQLKALNWLLYDEAAALRADAVVTVINPKTGAMEIGNAGKLGMLLIDSHGQPTKLGNPQAPPLGSQKNADYAGAAARIADDCTLALFSRGCIKACNASGEAIGEKRFLAALCSNAGQPAPTALEDMLSEVAPFLSAGQLPDDATVVLAHRNPPG